MPWLSAELCSRLSWLGFSGFSFAQWEEAESCFPDCDTVWFWKSWWNKPAVHELTGCDQKSNMFQREVGFCHLWSITEKEVWIFALHPDDWDRLVRLSGFDHFLYLLADLRSSILNTTYSLSTASVCLCRKFSPETVHSCRRNHVLALQKAVISCRIEMYSWIN